MSSLKQQVQELKKEVQELKQMVDELVKEEKHEDGEQNENPLISAIRQQDAQAVMKFLLHDRRPVQDDSTVEYFCRAMLVAVEVGNQEIINYFLLALKFLTDGLTWYVLLSNPWDVGVYRILHAAIKCGRQQVIEWFIDTGMLRYVSLADESVVFDTHSIEIMYLQLKHNTDQEKGRGDYPGDLLDSTTVDHRLIECVDAGMFDEEDNPKESPMYRQYLKERAQMSVDLIRKTRSHDVTKAIMSFV